jgi:transcriptional regulator with XRE-family HTH domain
MKLDRLTPPPAMLRELGERMARVRQHAGLTQQDLAAAAGVGIATLRRLEDGRDGKLGSWLRLLVALGQDAAIEQLLPAEFRSPLVDVKGRRKRRAKAATATGDGGFRWGDERS